LGLTFSVDIFRGDGSDLNCCYFADATSSMAIDPFKPSFRVPFFKGARGRGGLFVKSERVGALHLRFRLSQGAAK